MREEGAHCQVVGRKGQGVCMFSNFPTDYDIALPIPHTLLLVRTATFPLLGLSGIEVASSTERALGRCLQLPHGSVKAKQKLGSFLPLGSAYIWHLVTATWRDDNDSWKVNSERPSDEKTQVW